MLMFSPMIFFDVDAAMLILPYAMLFDVSHFRHGDASAFFSPATDIFAAPFVFAMPVATPLRDAADAMLPR